MASVPPPLIRALVITPIVYVGCLVVTILSPVLHLVLALVDLVDRKNWRFTRLGGLGIAFCVVEWVGLTLGFFLWMASGFGLWMKSEPIQKAHRWAFEVWLLLITNAIKTFIGFDFSFPSEELRTGPTVVFSRHTGPGDALLVARSLVHDQHRRIRMLGTTKLLWDPFFNHVVRRLPFYFCEPQPRDAAGQLEAVRHAVRTIEADGAMIIFPEGGNFTPSRHESAMKQLSQPGLEDRYARAERLKHVLPPRTGGTVAALEGASGAEVVFLAHAGLDNLYSLSDLWASMPLDRTVEAGYWYADGDIPIDDRDATIAWLYDQWQQVDDWIDTHL